ncbi:EthD domain-containing protein [Sphingobium sp. Sx8-8]|uniref:EthD domain-containing protein n=1 Tax=Sphingobium sp. Sx8-8 TaxID=2933617 RepID=UPI001F59ABC6|nr:EthD domain-containing protein [Sphingobium sp. Sx8-8]
MVESPKLEGEAGFRCLALIEMANEESLETNQAHWREDDPFRSLRDHGARHYVRALALRSDQPLFRPRTYIGVAEYWTDDEAAALAIHARLRDRSWLKAHPVFRDARLTLLANREHGFIGHLHDCPPDGITAIFFNKRKEDMSVEAYQHHWRDVHGPMVFGAPGLARYLQLHRLPATYDGDDTALDGAAEMSWLDAAGQATYSAAEDYQQKFRDDMPNLWDMRAGVRMYVRKEEVFHDR